MEESDQKNSMSILSYLILSIIILLILIAFYGKVFDVWKSGSDSQICRKSVELHSGLHIKGLNPYEDLKCPPSYEKISNTDDNIVKKEIANMMADCFWKFGGDDKLELFGEDGTYCALCNYIEFKGSAKNKQISDFRKFLATEPVPIKYDYNISYAHYFLGRPLSADEYNDMLTGQTEIDTSNDYGVMFLYSKDRYMHKIWAGATGGTTAAVLTAIGGVLLVIPDVTITKLAAVVVLSMASGAAGGAVGYDLGSDKAYDHGHGVILIPYDEDDLKELQCTQMPVKQGNK